MERPIAPCLVNEMSRSKPIMILPSVERKMADAMWPPHGRAYLQTAHQSRLMATMMHGLLRAVHEKPIRRLKSLLTRCLAHILFVYWCLDDSMLPLAKR